MLRIWVLDHIAAGPPIERAARRSPENSEFFRNFPASPLLCYYYEPIVGSSIASRALWTCVSRASGPTDIILVNFLLVCAIPGQSNDHVATDQRAKRSKPSSPLATCITAQRHRYFIFCRGLVSNACFEAPTPFLCPPVSGKLATTASHGILRVACRHRGASSAKPRRLALSPKN